jgi:hypothetical protein
MDWWKEAIFKKYFVGMRKRCLDHPLLDSKGSTLWKLLKTSLPIIKSKLSWVLGNGKIINVWTYSIKGSPPLESIEELSPIKQWFFSQGCMKLVDLSDWTNQGIGRDGSTFIFQTILRA